jgi:hypothetical protein
MCMINNNNLLNNDALSLKSCNNTGHKSHDHNSHIPSKHRIAGGHEVSPYHIQGGPKVGIR